VRKSTLSLQENQANWPHLIYSLFHILSSIYVFNTIVHISLLKRQRKYFPGKKKWLPYGSLSNFQQNFNQKCHFLSFVQSFVYLVDRSVCKIRAPLRHTDLKSEETYQTQEVWALEWSFYGFSLQLSEHVLHSQPARKQLYDKAFIALSFELRWGN